MDMNEFNNVKLGPTEAIFYSVKEIWFVIVTSIKYLGSMITGSGDSSQLGGPIRIAKITGQVAEYGIIPFLSVMAYISISLGLINLFPIPMLDGGHLMFYLFEKLLGRPLQQKTQEGFFRIGIFLLFSLMSISAWITLAFGANSSSFPVIRSSKRIPKAIIKSHSCTIST